MPAIRIRLLALDIDGTLLTSEHRVTNATRAAIRDARERGVEIVLASARGPWAIAPIMAELGISGFVVAYMGAVLCHLDPLSRSPSQAILEHAISLHAAHAVVVHARTLGVDIGWMGKDDWMVENITPVIEREAAILATPPRLVPDLTALKTTAFKLQCMLAPQAKPAPLEELRARLPADCAAGFSSHHYLEVVAQGLDKAAALIQLGRLLRIEAHEMAAIGDGENDITMLETVGLGIAMGHAKPHVVKAAKWVTESNDADGVAAAIKRMDVEARLPKLNDRQSRWRIG